MGKRHHDFQGGAIYHIYNRGVDRQTVFSTHDACAEFLGLMRRYLSGTADVLSYCLMTNHYHMTVQLKHDAFSTVLGKMLATFVLKVNADRGRVGTLFQGRFKSLPVTDDEQLVHLTCYHHVNPVAARLVTSSRDWMFSSYRDYLGLRPHSLVKTEQVLALAGGRDAYEQYVENFAQERYGFPVQHDSMPPSYAHTPYYRS
jgi:REP element-mobilizing transposase RayT